MNIKNIAFILFLLAAVTSVQAATFRVQAPTQVVAGEKFDVRYVLDADGPTPNIPPLEGARLLYGPTVATSSSVSIINGNASSSFSKIFTMLYLAETPGKHTIAPASVVVDGKRLTTRPTTIEILPSGSSAPSASQQQHYANPPTAPDPGNIPDYSNPMKQSAGSNIDPNDFFVRVTLSKDVVYEQEAVVCTIKLYTRYSVSQFRCTQQPSFNGFIIEELPVSNNFQLVEMVNGKRYATTLRVGRRCHEHVAEPLVAGVPGQMVKSVSVEHSMPPCLSRKGYARVTGWAI